MAIRSFRKMLTENSTQAALGTPAVIPALSLTGWVTLEYFPDWVKFIPFGTDANNETINYRLWGASVIGGLFIPQILLQFLGTFGTAKGVAGADVDENQFFCDTIGDPTTNFGTKAVDCQPYSPQNDTPGSYLLDTRGCHMFKLEIGLGTGASGNGLIGPAGGRI